MGGDDGGATPTDQNELMNLDGSFSSLISFDDPVTHLGGCAISGSQLITMGSLSSNTDAWLFDVDANTKEFVGPTNYGRRAANCVKMTDTQIIVIGGTHTKHVETFDLKSKTWTQEHK